MGRYKEKLKKIHRKKIRKAKDKIKLYYKHEVTYKDLNALAKKLLVKRQKKEKKSA